MDEKNVYRIAVAGIVISLVLDYFAATRGIGMQFAGVRVSWALITEVGLTPFMAYHMWKAGMRLGVALFLIAMATILYLEIFVLGPQITELFHAALRGYKYILL